MAPRIIAVVGPTACGKTALGVALAKAFRGEVVSVDSMQIYRRMTIGTAAPTEEEMEGIPHHMVAVSDPSEPWSAARYAAQATVIIDDILARGKLPILVGGTGLWLDAVVKGHGFAPGYKGGRIREELQQRLAREGMDVLWKELQAIDPDAAARLHPSDEKRVLRALEVYYETGTTITAHNLATQALPPRYDAIYIGLQFREREQMRRLIDLRVDRMVEQGLLQEVRQLLSSGLSPDATSLQAIGYKEFLGVAQGELTVDEAITQVKLRSRQYAKRQLTWLRKNPAIHWFYWEETRDISRALQFSTEVLAAHGLSLE